MQACRVRTGATITSLSLPHTTPTRFRSLANIAALHQPEQSLATRERVSILLQKTVSLLPRTLSTADGAIAPESSLFWSNLLERSITELSSGSDQVPLKATVAGKRLYDCVVRPFIPDSYCPPFVVCGFDKWAGSHDLVTALLEDPFTSDPTYSELLRNRWQDAPSCVNTE